jgi:hypothetical protein
MSLPFPARLDETAWASYRRLLTKKAARDHVVTVQHAKAQNTIGLGSLGFCFKIQTIFQIIPYFLFFKTITTSFAKDPGLHLDRRS